MNRGTNGARDRRLSFTCLQAKEYRFQDDPVHAADNRDGRQQDSGVETFDDRHQNSCLGLRRGLPERARDCSVHLDCLCDAEDLGLWLSPAGRLLPILFQGFPHFYSKASPTFIPRLPPTFIPRLPPNAISVFVFARSKAARFSRATTGSGTRRISRMSSPAESPGLWVG